MHFLVTGGTGFIGSHLVEHLLNKGHSVTIVDNLHSGNMENLMNVKNKVTFYRMDILEYDKLREIVKNVDGVFHEAALTVVQESFDKPDEYNLVNVEGTESIFKLAKDFGIKVVYASSSSVYGNPVRIPIKEDAARNPLNPYGMTKLKDEYLAEEYSSKGAKIIGLRYFNVYGKGQSVSYAGVITKFLEKIRDRQSPIINGDGLQIRDFVYVGDVAKANLLAMESKVDFAFINIGSGKLTTILELAQMIIGASGLELKPIHEKPLLGDVRESLADISLAKRLLDWNPEIELEDWLKKIISKYKSE